MVDLWNFLKVTWVVDFVLIILISVLYFFMIIYVFFTERKKYFSGSKPFVTIQIPTQNEVSAIRCARKCLSLDYPTEIIIGDDSTDESVSAKIREFAFKYDEVKVTKRKTLKGNKAGNLNHMLKKSRGDVIIVMDSDCVPGKNFLDIVKPFNDSNVGAVQAHLQISNLSRNLVTTLGGTFHTAATRIAQPFISRFHGSCSLLGTACAVRRDLLEELGGWDQESINEDLETSLRILEKGYDVVYYEGASASCETPFRLKDLLRQHTRWSYGTIQAIKNHLVSWFKSPQSIKRKTMIFSSMSGYMLSLFTVYLLLVGIILVSTGNMVFLGIPLNLLATGAIVFAVTGLVINGNKKLVPKFFMSLVLLGIMLISAETLGVFKALLGLDQKWKVPRKSLDLD